jgi:hypothetical protein
MKENDTGGPCGMYGRQDRCIQDFGGETYCKELRLGNIGVDGGMILKLVFKKCDGVGGMNWIDLARDRDRWRALLSAVMNLRVRLN